MAFLRNSLSDGHRREGKAAGFGASMQVGKDPRAVTFFVGGGTGVTVGHAEPQGIVDRTAILRAVAVTAFCLPIRDDSRR